MRREESEGRGKRHGQTRRGESTQLATKKKTGRERIEIQARVKSQ